MHRTWTVSALGALAIVTAIACSDSGALGPDAQRTVVATNGQSDTTKSTPPTTNPSTPKPDSGKTQPTSPSSEPRLVSGTVIGMGPVSDSANYQKVAGATVVWSSSDGKELARAVSAADGSFSLGSFKPATYMLSVTPPASGPFKGTQWSYPIGEYSSAKVELTVWLGRK